MSLLKLYSMVLMDLGLALASFWLAFFLRFEFDIPAKEIPLIVRGMAVVFVLQGTSFFAWKTHRLVLNRITFEDSVKLLAAIMSGAVAIGAFLHLSQSGYPRSVYLLYPLILASLVVSLRYAGRILHEKKLRRNKTPNGQKPRRYLLIGAGTSGVQLVRALRQLPHVRVVGFVDDNPSLTGKEVCAVPILATCDEFATLAKKPPFDEIVIAIPSATTERFQRIWRLFKRYGKPIKTLPRPNEFLKSRNPVFQLRPVDVRDLMCRDPIVIDGSRIGSFLNGKTVFVTGAAGSIGAEICRQIAVFKPGALHLIDMAESALYETAREIAEDYPGLALRHHLIDLKNRDALENLFAATPPHIVFHAAAYKHVPMLEDHPHAAVLNNILGGKNTADLAVTYGVARFVLISSDKAVNPASLMGCTKRVLERYIRYLDGQGTCRFNSVRFGNVLESNGSILRIFQRQARKGGPLTVTHEDAERYFMTIPEASQLVLQAAAMGEGGEIFMLDMGDPVNIKWLAENFVEIWKNRMLNAHLGIEIIGLRPGEKLKEELCFSWEKVRPTDHSKIAVLHGETDDAMPAADLAALIETAKRRDPAIKTLIRKAAALDTETPVETAL